MLRTHITLTALLSCGVLWESNHHAVKALQVELQANQIEEADAKTVDTFGIIDRRQASQEPEKFTGEYICEMYGKNKNAWHYVTITHDGRNKFTWTNQANVSWSLFQNAYVPTLFGVGRECPYYDWGNKDAANFMMTEVYLDGNGEVTGIRGPWNELYVKQIQKSQVDSLEVVPIGEEPILSRFFDKKVEVFGVLVVGTSEVRDEKLLHAAAIMAEYLDNDEDGEVDDPAVVEAMQENNALLVMFPTYSDFEDFLDNTSRRDKDRLFDNYSIQDLYDEETNEPGRFDAALEEVLHLIQTSGYARVYNDLSHRGDTALLDALDAARGGRFEIPPETYPPEAWFHYDDETCSRRCMAVEYFYWGLTSLLGAQANQKRCQAISNEWELCNPEDVQTRDPVLYELLTREAHKLPTKLPNGVYGDLDCE